MPLNTIVKMEVCKNIERYEGRIPHLYLDTVGKVTVGIGHMVPNKGAMASVVMYKKGVNNELILAILPEKIAEYEAIKKLQFGRRIGAGSFKKYTSLTMKDIDINMQRDKHIQSFYVELTNYYTTANGFSKAFDVMPAEVQKALFDMVFNLGLTKLINQYTQFNAALKIEEWGDAAKQSNRIGIHPMRNKYVFDLLIEAQRQKKLNGEKNEQQVF